MNAEDQYFSAFSNEYINCVNYISGKIDLDCLINKNIYQWHNFILYGLIACYVILTLYPVYNWIMKEKFIVKKYIIPVEVVAHTIISVMIFIILYLENRIKLLGIIIIFIITTIVEYMINKKFQE